MHKLAAVAALLLLAPAAALSEDRATTKDAERMVHKAVEFLKKEGQEKAFKVFSDPKGPFTYRDLYIVVLDLNGVVKAHGSKAELIGKNNMKAQDANGKYFTRETIELCKAKGGGWIEYQFENPATHKLETKVAYFELVDGVVVGCGAFKS
jgi:cytochrome c